MASSRKFEKTVNELIDVSDRIKNGVDVASSWPNKFENAWKDEHKSEPDFEKRIFVIVGEMFESNPEGIGQDHIVAR